MSETPEQPNLGPPPGSTPSLPETIEPRTAVVRDPETAYRPQLSEKWKRRQQRAWILFLLTCLSTFFAGRTFEGVYFTKSGERVRKRDFRDDNGKTDTKAIQKAYDGGEIYNKYNNLNGVLYAVAVMGILLAHEMGHYLQARRYGVPATLPFFIPMPISPFGTMGAVILQGAGTADRKAMFDIAITGPIAGLIIAIPVLIAGVKTGRYDQIPEGMKTISYGEPLVLEWLAETFLGPRKEGYDLILNPLLFAGWVGIFITSLNLIPIGQLDGGHILFCLIGKRAHDIALIIVGFGAAYCVFVDWSYVVLIVLLMLMGIKHPPTKNDTVPLGRFRKILGWLTLSFIIIGFTPKPITLPEEESDDPVEVQADYGDGQAAYHFRRHAEVLDLRMSIRNSNRHSTRSSSGTCPGFTVFENHHLTGLDA